MIVNRRKDKSTHVTRILHCSAALTFGGEQKQLSKMLSHINRKKYRLYVCCIRPFGYIEPNILKFTKKLLCLNIRYRYNVPLEVFKLIRVVRRHKIDLMISGIFGSDFSPIITALVTRIPIAVFLTTTYDLKQRLAAEGPSNVFFQNLKYKGLYRIHSILARITNIHYVAYSNTIKQSAISNLHLPKNKISILPLGQDPSHFDASTVSHNAVMSLKNQLGVEDAYPILLNVGRLAAVKGQKDLIQSMLKISSVLPNARLLIAGDGTSEYYEELHKVRDLLNLREYVHFLGRRDDIPLLLNICDIFLFSSYYEGLPGSVIEAIASAKPVVAFDIEAVSDLVIDGKTGTLIKNRNIDGFAQAVITMAQNNGLIHRMGDQGRQLFLEKYDIQHNIVQLEKLFSSILDKHKT